jgi:hypothetical protein
MKYGKYWFHLQKNIFIANLHVLGQFIPKNEFRAKKNIRLSHGVAGIAECFWTKFEAQLA